MKRLTRKLLILVVLIGALGFTSSHAAGGKGTNRLPCCSWCFNICDRCEVDPSYCARCNNCLGACNGSC